MEVGVVTADVQPVSETVIAVTTNRTRIAERNGPP